MPRRPSHILRAFFSLTVAAALGLVAFADRAIAAGPLTTVHIAGEAFGFLPAPCNRPSGMELAINVDGRDGTLDGSGTTHASPGATNQLALEDSPVQVDADMTAGAVHVTLGPLAGGVFRGQILQFDGAARVTVMGN